jgi:hypothetical protein
MLRRSPIRSVATALAASMLLVASPPNLEPAEAAIPALPASEVSSPAIVASAPGRTDVFVRTSTGRLSYRYRLPGGSWTRSIDLGGSLASQPAVAARSRIHVAARWTDGTIRIRSTTSTGGWGAWTSLGGTFTSAPALASPASNRLDIVARGTDGQLRWRTRLDGTWSKWRTLSGVVASSPAMVSRSTGRLNLVARRADGRLISRSYTTSGGWGNWGDRGGSLGSQPAITSPASDRLDVVVRHPDGTMRLRRWYSPTGWSAWTKIGDGPFRSGPGATRDRGAIRVAAVRTSGSLRLASRSSPAAAWSSWSRIDALRPVRGLGTWIDAFDYDLNPEASVADMKARGVRTLYLATARFLPTPSAQDFQDEALMGRWLDAAHTAGIRVVGWYVPGYGDLARDVRRTVAIERYVSPKGNRFDAIGIDIERFRDPGKPISQWNGEVGKDEFLTLLVTHLKQVRSQTHAVIVAIVPTPYATDPGSRWSGFPWASVGSYSDVTVPMVLWTFRSGYTPTQVRTYVADQVARTRSLTGDPVHVEGGVDGEGTIAFTSTYVGAFVNGAFDGKAIGGSNYDYRTTKPTYWSVLVRLNEL